MYVLNRCVAQQEGEKLLRRVPEIDLVMGPQYANRLGDLLEDVMNGNQVREYHRSWGQVIWGREGRGRGERLGTSLHSLGTERSRTHNIDPGQNWDFLVFRGMLV